MIIGSTVTVIVDRPKGSFHPAHKDIIYPINYGYIEGVIAGDGMAQDCYILGVDQPVKTFTGTVIAIVKREDDNEDKWVVSNKEFSKEEIIKQTYFMEQYFKSTVVNLLPPLNLLI
jgi:inorganic pyrophosphatase